MSLTVSVDVKQHCTVLRHWSQFVPNMPADIRGQEALLHHHRYCLLPPPPPPPHSPPPPLPTSSPTHLTAPTPLSATRSQSLDNSSVTVSTALISIPSWPGPWHLPVSPEDIKDVSFCGRDWPQSLKHLTHEIDFTSHKIGPGKLPTLHHARLTFQGLTDRRFEESHVWRMLDLLPKT